MKLFISSMYTLQCFVQCNGIVFLQIILHITSSSRCVALERNTIIKKPTLLRSCRRTNNKRPNFFVGWKYQITTKIYLHSKSFCSKFLPLVCTKNVSNKTENSLHMNYSWRTGGRKLLQFACEAEAENSRDFKNN